MNPLNAKVLFVQSGIPFYYPSLEISIYNALQKVVQAVTMVSSKEAIKTAIKTKPEFIVFCKIKVQSIAAKFPACNFTWRRGHDSLSRHASY